MLTENFGWPRSPVEPTRPLLRTAEVVLRIARISHPDVSQRIARTEAQRLGNVSLCLLGATYEDLTKSDNAVRRRKISIQLQRVLAFDDALCAGDW